jgi:hypothetical protein
VFPGQAGIEVEVEGRAGTGWSSLEAIVKNLDAPPHQALRRAAMSEFERLGIGYILAMDSSFAGPDLKERAGLWGVEELARSGTLCLYRLRRPVQLQ